MNNSTRMMLMKNRQAREEKSDNKDDKHNSTKANESKKITALSRDTAELWVSKMSKPDGTFGGKWTYEQTSQLMKQKNFDCSEIDFYISMNMIHSDYGKTLSKYGVSSADAYAELAYDWIKDVDVKAGAKKTEIYYNYIVK